MRYEPDPHCLPKRHNPVFQVRFLFSSGADRSDLAVAADREIYQTIVVVAVWQRCGDGRRNGAGQGSALRSASGRGADAAGRCRRRLLIGCCRGGADHEVEAEPTLSPAAQVQQTTERR
jgi:hypothetical protein